LERARAFIRQVGPETTQVALAYDGYVTIGGVRTDAVFAAVQATGTPTSDLFAQRYDTGGGTLVEIGNAKHVAIEQPSLFATPATMATAPARAADRAPNAKRSAFARLRGR
jgi:hypothetical protein